MQKHLDLLGILYLVFSLLGILAAGIVFTVLAGSGILSGEVNVFAITATIGGLIALFLFLISLPGAIGGIGLLRRYSWARTFGLILGALNLFNIPFGTALGLYTFWVLLNDETSALFARKA